MGINGADLTVREAHSGTIVQSTTSFKTVSSTVNDASSTVQVSQIRGVVETVLGPEPACCQERVGELSDHLKSTHVSFNFDSQIYQIIVGVSYCNKRIILMRWYSRQDCSRNRNPRHCQHSRSFCGESIG